MKSKYGNRITEAFNYAMEHREQIESLSAVADKFDIPAHALHSYMSILRKKGQSVPSFPKSGHGKAKILKRLVATTKKPTISQFILKEPERLDSPTPSAEGQVSVFLMKGSASAIERVAQSLARFMGGHE